MKRIDDSPEPLIAYSVDDLDAMLTTCSVARRAETIPWKTLLLFAESVMASGTVAIKM